ncbi:DUF1270 family protein [Streptomyces sp. NPDC088090]
MNLIESKKGASPMNKSFLIALLSWIVLSLALTFAGIYFTTALGIAMLISIAAFVFFEYEFFQIKKTEC